MYQLEKGICRKSTNCVKWDSEFITDEVIPMWIADMDFEVAPAITEALYQVVKRGAFGYHFLSDKYYEAVINWMKKRHHYEVQREWICYVPNVVMGLSFAVAAVSEPGDEVIVQTPVYGPFFKVVENQNRVLVESKLINQGGYYTIDYEDFESKITEKTKAVLLCNPHNPAGRVWKKEELLKFAEICIKHKLYIISDEIHSDLIAKGNTHTMIGALSEEIAEHSIICTSPSKAFNLASIHVANCLIRNEKVRRKFVKIAEESHGAECNAFAEAALVSAYEKSEEWLDELNEYLECNIDFFLDYIHTQIPRLIAYKPEGTYLVWVDFKDINIPPEGIQDFLLHECHIAVNQGEFFGEAGKGYARFNLACPRKNIQLALERLKERLLSR